MCVQDREALLYNKYEHVILLSLSVPSAPPRSVQEGGLTTSRMSLIQWETVEDIHRNGEIVSYTLRYGRISTGGINTVSILASNAEFFFFNVTSLTPGVVYFLEVAASTRLGIGEFSESIHPQTLEERKTDKNKYCIIQNYC